MASQNLNEETGEISMEKLPFMYVEWKVQENLCLPWHYFDMIYSPTFHFRDGLWNFHLTHRGTAITGSDCVELCLVKKNPSTSRLRVHYNIGVKAVHGYTYGSVRGEIVRDFEKESDNFGNFLLFSADSCENHLAEQNSHLVSKGLVTFFCHFWVGIQGSLYAKPPDRNYIKRYTVNENIGDISTETAPYTYIEWKIEWIPGILLLSEDTTHAIQSPSFQFKGATWNFQMMMNPENFRCGESTYGPIDFTLRSKDWDAPRHHIDYRIGIKSVDGHTYSIQCGEGFRSRGCYIWTNLLCRSDLLKDQQTLAPNGVMTFVCYLRLECSSSLDVISKTMCDDYPTEKPTVLRSPSTVLSPSSLSCTPEKLQLSTDSPAEKPTALTSPSTVSPPSSLTCIPEKLQLSTGLEKLGTDLKNLFVSGEDSDVTIKVKNKEFKAHKYILRARSPVFYSMFTHDMAEKNSGTVNVADCDPDAFEIFLLYLYSGNMENFSTNTVFDLYGAADKYDAEELKLKCKEFMLSSLSVDTVCDVVEHALQYDETELLKVGTDFFAKNFKKVILTVKWLTFLKNNPVATNELLIKTSNYVH